MVVYLYAVQIQLVSWSRLISDGFILPKDLNQSRPIADGLGAVSHNLALLLQLMRWRGRNLGRQPMVELLKGPRGAPASDRVTSFTSKRDSDHSFC
jgi:hypothetical protein